MRKFFNVAFPFIIVLAVIGFVFTVINNPMQIVQSILFIVGFIALFYFGYRFYLSRKYGTPFLRSGSKDGPTRAQLKKAKRTSTVRATGPTNQSKLKPNSTVQMKRNQKPFKKTPKRRSGPTLTVIEGKKNRAKPKKKNRASF
ncbi:SA1362 family protein [Alkalihalobacillus sp. FSL W8-0930]